MLYTNEMKIETAKRLRDLRIPEENIGRKGLGLKKSEVALKDKTGIYISHSTLGNYEQTNIDHKRFNDGKSMTIETLFALSEFYSVSIEYLLGLSGSKSTDVTDQAINERLGLSDKAIKVFLMYNSLSKQVYKGYINYLIENIFFERLVDIVRSIFGHRVDDLSYTALNDTGALTSIADIADKDLKKNLISKFGDNAYIITNNGLLDFEMYKAKFELDGFLLDIVKKSIIIRNDKEKKKKHSSGGVK